MTNTFTTARLILLLIFAPLSLLAQVNVSFPVSRIVLQRDLTSHAPVYVAGTVSQPMDIVEARLVTRGSEPGEAVGWVTIANNLASGAGFSGSLTAKAGRYNLEVKGTKSGVSVTTTIDKVGIGEVFLIVGHSNAAGMGEYSYETTNDFVNSINTKLNTAQEDLYKQTASPDDLPFNFSQLCKDCGLAPFGYTSGMWSKLGELLVQQLNVPVLFYSAAFGGSNMLQTKLSMDFQYFEHGFINWQIGMPYVNISNTLNKYVPKTGIRAILSSHGVNDGGSTQQEFYDNHIAVINRTRLQAGYENLAWLVATSCYNNGVMQHILNAQETIITTKANVYRGANLNSIGNEGRGNPDLALGSPDRDKLHFNSAGVIQAGTLWKDAIMNVAPNFLTTATPIMAKSQAPPPLPVNLVSFRGKIAEGYQTKLDWQTTAETNNSHFEVEYSVNAKIFETIGRVQGAGNSKASHLYSYVIDKPMPSISYYRLKQVDFDGTFSMSRTIAVIKEDNEFYISPNPSASLIDIHAEGSDQIESVVFINSEGLVVMQKKNMKAIDVSLLPKGEYIVQTQILNGKLLKKKFIKL